MMDKWISGLLGLAVMIIPFLTLSDRVLTWSLVITGLVIAMISFWSLVAQPPTSRRLHGSGSQV